ncbi:MAG: hypothetical protein J6B04_01000 [Clostridia bacterium]|nr:hypothetical protein [Clostridia bacterium]
MIKKNKPLFISIISVLSLICVICIFLVVWFFGDSYKDFDENFDEVFAVQDWDSGMVPQGMCNSTDNKYFYISTYMKDGSASRLYVYERTTTTTGATDYKLNGYVTMKYGEIESFPESKRGEVYTGHAGGVATYGDKLWVASGNRIFVLSVKDVRAAATDNGEVTFTETFKVDNEASFCFYGGGYLYVGEFYRSGNYETAESHAYKNNKALYLAFKVNTSKNRGVETIKPEYAVSIPDKIQGMAIAGNYIVLSESYSLPKSHVYLYDKNQVMSKQVGTVNVTYGSGNDDIPLYCVNDYEVRDYTLPAMAEGLCTYNGEVYIVFENNCTKYRLVNREKNEYVYKFKPEVIVEETDEHEGHNH